MTKPAGTENKPKRRFFAAGLAGTVAAVAAVYVILGPDGNSGSAHSCALALETAAAVKPHAAGEVAAFLPAQKSLPLNTIAFKAPDGSAITVDDFEGRTVLINLWATWCAPCRKEMPALDQLQADLGDDNFEVVAVNLDRGGPEKPLAFLDEIGVTSLQYYHDSSNKMLTDLRSKGRGTGLPTTILVGPEGCEIGTMYGPAEWASGEAKTLINAALANLSRGEG